MGQAWNSLATPEGRALQDYGLTCSQATTRVARGEGEAGGR